ncbi:P-loop containing nucleoside triphosphate hydrolase protein [Mytilinidion resinicola]|uniref:RNA helicase n=1 Tax=Mytilinidion resinicola TaxID=574789 RepID=A0A6A6YIT5_9PEZI|nr:P-loop containing nucleoside triphosphate hydrolase protein [Mytilinidion resinicola]KAF2808711.1 P-loop containing nucleoside triphosphate hydrolase protein [Mytilinidion resinicola]
MLRPTSRLCPFCEVRSILNTKPSPIQSPWQQSRHYGQLQRRKPSRMELSPNVGRTRDPPRSMTDSKPPEKKAVDPFGNLNQREARVQPPPQRKRTELEHKQAYNARERGSSRKRPEAFKALKMQRALAPVPYGDRAAVKSQISDLESFDEFPLLPSLKKAIADALPGLEDVSPTPAQRVAIPALLGVDDRRRKRNPVEKKGMEQFLLAAETGSGKTLAYLLPVIDAIKRAEVIEAEEEAQAEAAEKAADAQANKRTDMFSLKSPPLSTDPHPTSARPRAIILVPTAELVVQVGQLAKALSHVVKFRTAPISAANTATVIRSRLFSPSGVDVVISTPHLLGSIAESNPNILSRVTHLVIDEADSLLDRSFSPTTSAIIDRSTPSLRQLILCSATIPRRLDSFLEKRFPDIKRLVTPNLHAIPRRVQLGVVDVNKEPYRGNKDLACADTIWTIGRATAEHSDEGTEHVELKRIIVFVNEREKAVEVADYLVTKGIDAVALNRDTSGERASRILASFKGLAKGEEAPVAEPAASDAPVRRRRLLNTKVIVTTDLGSRGIDTLAVRHVILYDVPHTTIDFIHRLGRTGRMGRRGRGIVLVGRGDRTDVVKEVREGMFKGQALI